MGTRALSGVVIDGEIKASYSQHDGYPSWLGKSVLNYAKTITDENIEEIRKAWRAMTLVDERANPTEEEIAALAKVGITSAEGVSTGADWYSWLRSLQGEMQRWPEVGFMLDSKDFGYHSLFCEWGYLIDLDVSTLECYVGFNREPLDVGRFSEVEKPENGYYGIKLVKVFSLGILPTEETFVRELNEAGS